MLKIRNINSILDILHIINRLDIMFKKNEKQQIQEIKNTLENMSYSIPNKKTSTFISASSSSQKNQIIRRNDFFFENEMETQRKIKEINKYDKKYLVYETFSPLKIGEFRTHQHHLENYQDLTNQMNFPISCVVVTYPLLTFHKEWNHFFSPFIPLSISNTHGITPSFIQRTFFHYFFSSYYHLANSFCLLNENGMYPFRLREEMIYFNKENIPLLSVPFSFHRTQNTTTKELLDFISHLKKEDFFFLPIDLYILFFLEREKKKVLVKEDVPFILEFVEKNAQIYLYHTNLQEEICFYENKSKKEIAKDCLENTLQNLNNYQLCLLYLKQLDKIIGKPFLKDEMKKYPFIKKVEEIFKKVVGSTNQKREKIQDTKEKIEGLFL